MTAGPGALLTPGDLMELSEQQIAALFGRPPFVRREEPAQVWQYKQDSCVLDLFLYREAAGYRVKHAEIRARSSNPQASCAALMRPRPAAV